MKDDDFEGSLVLEKLAEVDLVDDFFEAIDSDDIERAVLLMKRAKVDNSMIAAVIKKIKDASGSH